MFPWVARGAKWARKGIQDVLNLLRVLSGHSCPESNPDKDPSNGRILQDVLSASNRRLTATSRESVRLTRPQEMYIPETPVSPSGQKPVLKHCRYDQFTLTELDVQSTAISPCGGLVALVTTDQYEIFRTSNPPSLICTGNFNFRTKEARRKSRAHICSAVSTKLLLLGIDTKIQGFQIADNSTKVSEIDIGQSIVNITFSPNEDQFLVLTRKQPFQYARIYSVAAERPEFIHPAIRWGETPLNKTANYSTNGTRVAICTDPATVIAQIRLLQRVGEVWQKYKQIDIHISSPEKLLSFDCKGLTGAALYNPSY